VRGAFRGRSDPLDPYAPQDVRRLGVPDADHLVTEGEGLLDLLLDLRGRVVEDSELAVDAQEDLLRLPLERMHDVDESVRHTGGEGLCLHLLDDLLDHGLRELRQLLLHLTLGLLCLLVLLLALTEGLLLLLAQLLKQLLVRLLLAELLELLQRAAAHAHRLLLAVALTLLLPERLLLAVALTLLLPERLLLVVALALLLPERLLLLVGRCARELLSLLALLSQLTHLRGDAHAGVTFP